MVPLLAAIAACHCWAAIAGDGGGGRTRWRIGRGGQCLKQTNIPKWTTSELVLFEPWDNHHASFGRNYLFGENAITKCGLPLVSFAGFEYGLWGIGFGGGSPIGYEGSLSRFKVKATSYYSVHPLILSATRYSCDVFDHLGSGFSSHIGWIVQSVTHHNALMVDFTVSPTKYGWCK